jgi:HAD superfamily hydrolase (TIGR01509 family)
MSGPLLPSQQVSTRGVLFDFDGTLGVTLPSWTSAFGTVMGEHGITPTEEELITYCFHSCTDEVIRNHGIEDGAHFKERVWAAVVELMSSVDHYPRIPETLGALRDEGYKMAVVTNSRREAVLPVLKRWNIDHHFDAVITIDDVSHGKPDPEMIHRAINQLNLSPSDTYIVGDSRADVNAGKRAGIRTIGFSPEENRKYMTFEALKDLGPSHLIHSYDKLWEVLGLPKSRY